MAFPCWAESHVPERLGAACGAVNASEHDFNNERGVVIVFCVEYRMEEGIVPQLGRVLKEEDLKSQRAPAGLDLAHYLDIIDTIREQGGVGGEVSLGATESQRTEKGRLTRAAKLRGFKLTWRKSTATMLRFVLSNPGSPPPDGRRRRRAK